MWARSPGSLVTTGAWWRMEVATTIASTTSAVGEAAHACGAADARVIGDDVAGFEHLGDLMLRSAPPGLGQDNDRPDPGGGQFVVQGQEIGVAPFGGQQRTAVVDNRGHQPAARCGGSSSSPVSSRNWRARSREDWGSGPRSLSYFAISSRAAARPAACAAAACAFSVAASASQADTGTPSSAAAA
jgi:hypothetical protein